MKKVKIILSALFLVFMVASLLYTNIISPEDKKSAFSSLSKMFMPLFLLFSFFLMYLKRSEEKKDKKKLSREDRQLFNSIESSQSHRDIKNPANK